MSAEKGSWRQDVPEFLQFLEGELGCKIQLHEQVLQFHLYFADLSDWKLRFSNLTPIICVTASDLDCMSPLELSQSLADVVRQLNLAERNPVALIDGPGEHLRPYLQVSLIPVLVLDVEDQQAVRASRRPTAELIKRLGVQLPLTLLAPYETSKPVTGSRFFGRAFEIRRILQASDSNFAIMGIRRIGKTSLMREIERRLRAEAQERADEQGLQRIIFMDCSAITSPQHFVQEVVRKLHVQELARLENRQYPIYFPDFLDRMARRYGGQLVFLLDEVDQLLVWQHRDASLLNALRASSNMGQCRYIIGGFREVMAASSSLDSPLFNFAKPIRLKEFNRDQTAEMVLGPLERLHVHFERRAEVVDRIYKETAGQPNLVQFYCSILVEQLDRQESRTVSPDNLFDVYSNEDFRAFILSTFMDNTSNLEKAIVFAVMGEMKEELAFGLGEIDAALEARNLELPLADLDRACRNLELAGTFIQRGAQYQFATPVFPRVLNENYDVEFLFRKVQHEGIW